VGSEYGSESTTSHGAGFELTSREVVARVSTHALREERAYHICKNLSKNLDPDGNHIIRPVDLVRLNPQPGDKSTIMVCIYESAGLNYLPQILDLGPAYYKGRTDGDNIELFRDNLNVDEPVPLQTFLDFAVGATECIELLHNGQRIVHGEIRGDAFHMNLETGSIKLINFGSGLRTFEHGLTSTGWSTLSKEIGAKTKLTFMSPEQTGRMPAEPDSRTDIYSLGILFWTMLTQQAAFDGETPMDIIQGVLSRRLPLVSTIRLNVPDVISRIIQKMTAKTIHERYHSASGLRYDLVEVRRLLSIGDAEALKNCQIATKDVSSFFILPDIMVGRTEEHDKIVRIIDKVAKKHLLSQLKDISGLSSESSLSEGRLECFIASSGIVGDRSTSEGENTSSGDVSLGTAGLFPGDPRGYMSAASQIRSAANSMHNSMDSHDLSVRSNPSTGNFKLRDKPNSLALESRSTVESINSDVAGARSNTEGVGALTRHRNAPKFRRKGRCEVVSISGAAGLGKSCLVQSVHVEARRRGYFASSKFDEAKKTPFGPVLKLLSSLFKQVFSESDTDTPFHQVLKNYVKPVWPMLHKVLVLPEFLLGPLRTPSKPTHSSQLSHSYSKRLKSNEYSLRDSSPTSSPATLSSMSLGTQSSQDFLRAGATTKSVRLMNTFLEVLRVFAQHKFICFCLDDLQFADDESLDLITQIISSGMKMVFIVTYRPEEILPQKIKGIIDASSTDGIGLPPGLSLSCPANMRQNISKAQALASPK
jgi:serine/threonine protein kinase